MSSESRLAGSLNPLTASTYFQQVRENGGMARNFGGLTTGLAGTLLLVGFILFIIPEPATSGIGTALMLAGLVLWVVQTVL